MKPREIEQTSKKLKAHIVCCYLLGFFGVLILCFGDLKQQGATLTAGLLWLTGGVWYIVTKFRIWWNNG